jgi:hypothetical protein
MSTIRVVGTFTSVQDALIEGLELCTFRVRDASFDYEYWGSTGRHEAVDIEVRESFIDLEVVVPALDDGEEMAEEDWQADAGHDVADCRIHLRAELMAGSEPTVEERNGFWVVTGSWRIEEVA